MNSTQQWIKRTWASFFGIVTLSQIIATVTLFWAERAEILPQWLDSHALPVLVFASIPSLLVLGMGLRFISKYTDQKIFIPLSKGSQNISDQIFQSAQKNHSIEIQQWLEAYKRHFKSEIEKTIGLEQEKNTQNLLELSKKTQKLYEELSSQIYQNIASQNGLSPDFKNHVLLTLGRYQEKISLAFEGKFSDTESATLQSNTPSQPKATCSIGGAIKSVVSEFRLATSASGIPIQLSMSNSLIKGFIPLSYARFTNVINELLISAMEASLESKRLHNEDPQVTLDAAKRDSLFEVELRLMGATWDLSHIEDLIELEAAVRDCGGSFEIERRNKDHLIRLILPETQAPAWFADITQGHWKSILIFDQSGKMENLVKSQIGTKEISTLKNEGEFLARVSWDKDALVLIENDHTLLHSENQSVIQWVNKTGLKDRAVIVSARASYDSKLREEAEGLGVKVFPRECLESP